MTYRISATDAHPRSWVGVLDSGMSFTDVGDGAPIVFLHGNPTSSYLWRNIIPAVADLGRCLAPDLIGMGDSGISSGGYDFADHVRYLDEWFDSVIGDQPVTLVLHDWGSALGFHWAARHPDQVRGIAYTEALVQSRLWSDFEPGRDELFRKMRSPEGWSLVIDQNFFVETVLPKSIIRQLTPSELNEYRSPFITPESRIPTLMFARELPIDGEPENVTEIVRSYGEWLTASSVPKLLIVAEPGALLTGRALEFARTFPNQTEVTVPGIHYVQEDSPREIGVALREFMQRRVNV